MVLGRARLHRLRKNSMLLAILGGAALQCVRENSFLGNPVERNARKSSPGGATELSPALQRWEMWKEKFKSRRDDRVLAHTLQRCENCIVLNAAAAEGTGRSSLEPVQRICITLALCFRSACQLRARARPGISFRSGTGAAPGKARTASLFSFFDCFLESGNSWLATSARVVLSRIRDAESRTARNTLYSARWLASRLISSRKCSASPNGASGPSITRITSLRWISDGARRNR